MKWTTPMPAPARRSGEPHFYAEDVIRQFEDAGRSLLRMPQAGFGTGARNFWPEIVRDKTEAYGYDEEQVRPGPPSAGAITRMDEVFRWLARIPHDRFVLRRIVGLRALVNPMTDRHLWSWVKIGDAIHANRNAVSLWHAQGIDLIVASLNGKMRG